MKRGTIRHPKLLRLATALRLPPFAALGLLEALLEWTFDYARDGAIGRHDNHAIAVGVGWEGDPDRLIAALITSRWLDPCATHRLVVHDLADHAPESWKRQMKYHGQMFAQPSPLPVDSSSRILDDSSENSEKFRTASPSPSPSPDLSFALLTQGDATSPRPTELGFETFWKPYPKKRHKPAALRAWKAVDGARHLEAIVAAVERWKGSEQWQSGRIEDPSTFLRQRQWEDAVPAAVASNSVEGMADRIRKKGLL